MNRYGRMAMEYAREHRPMTFAAMEHPVRYFTELGLQVQAAVTTTRDELLGHQHHDEPITTFQARGHQALRTAEELMLADLVWLPPEPMTPTGTETDVALDAYHQRLRLIDETLAELT